MAKNAKKNDVVKAQAPATVAVELPPRSWFVPMGFAVRVEHPVTATDKSHVAYAEYQGSQILEKVEQLLADAGIKVYVAATDAAYVGETTSGMAARAKMAPPPVPGAAPAAAPATPAAPTAGSVYGNSIQLSMGYALVRNCY
jgi:hypothetical protein